MKQRAFFVFFFTPRSHAAESLPGFIVDNHKIFLMVVVGGEGGAEGLGWDLPEVESPIGCQDKFHHIVKKNVIGCARIARLCLNYCPQGSEVLT